MRQTVSLRDFLTVFFKYKNSILLFWGVVLITVFIGNQIMAPTFEAESSVMVNFGREYLYIPEIGKQPPYNYYDRSGLINAEIEILASRDLAEKVIHAVGVDRLYPLEKSRGGAFISKLQRSVKTLLDKLFSGERAGLSRAEKRLAEAIDEFAKNLSVLGSKESNVIRIIFQNGDPEVAAEAVNILVERYQEKHLEMFRDKQLTGFLEGMVKKYQAALQESEQKLEAYKKKHGALALNLEEEILIRQRGEFDSLWKNTKIEVNAARARLASFEEQIRSMSETSPLFSETAERDRVIDNTKAELLSLKLKEKELLGTFKENSTQVRNIRERIQLVESFLEEQQTTKQSTVRVGLSLAYQEIEHQMVVTRADLMALQAKSESVKEKLAMIDDDLNAYLSNEQIVRHLVRQRQINEENYLAYSEKFEDARINGAMDDQVMTNIRVVHRADVPYEPVKPRKVLNLLVAMILGGLGGIGIAFYRNFLDQGINTPENLERLVGLPVLTTISLKKKAEMAKRVVSEGTELDAEHSASKISG